ncbi:MAG TPA: thiol reductant ABC exporter subunit CydD [Chloroflexota bacterium]|nr:thiol reductant ABC exporter subunit CydD [Chloroflexota bacterium]
MSLKRQGVHAIGAVRATTGISVVLGLAATGLVIVQFGLLSHIVAGVFLGHASLADVLPAATALLAVTAGRALCAGMGEVVAGTGAAGAIGTLRARLFAQLAALGPAHAATAQSGELSATAGEGIDRLAPYLGRYLPQRYLAVLVPPAIGAVVLVQDRLSGILLLATAPLIPLLMALVGSYANEHIRAQWQTLTRLSAALLDAIQGLPTLVLHNRGEATAGRVAAVGDEFRVHTMRALRFAFLNSLVLEFMTTASIALVAAELGVRLLSGGIAFERALWILLLAPEFFRPLRDLGTYRHAAMEGQAALERVDQILAMPLPLLPARARELPAGPLTVELRDVDFTYPSALRPALHDINLRLDAGTRTALVGPSGAGKSTLLNLLMGYLQPSRGTIAVNGVPLTELDPDAWRSLVALVPQRPHLFFGTVRDNIRLGRPDTGEDEVAWAAEQAGAAEFIRDLPLGYDTPIGERGARLSGGQAQRLAIARAFLKDAPLVILDEPTSHLDPESERQIRRALERLSRGRTVLMVAHRLNTIYTADRIAVLSDGALVETGTHDELRRQGGVYTGLVAGKEVALA